MIYDGQYFVSLGHTDLLAEKRGKYALYRFSKAALDKTLSTWPQCTKWERRSQLKPTILEPRRYHPTAIGRYAPPRPMLDSFTLDNHGDPSNTILYHGCGRDDEGFLALARKATYSERTNKRSRPYAKAYDPYCPWTDLRQKPTGQFDEIHSHYTLNVVDQATGLAILGEIHQLLKPEGRAIISVRRDGEMKEAP